MARGGGQITAFNAFAALPPVGCKNCHAGVGTIGGGGNMSPTEVIERAAGGWRADRALALGQHLREGRSVGN